MRHAGRAVVDADPTAAQAVENGASPTRALVQEGEDTAQALGDPLRDAAGPELPVRFLVEVPATTVDLLIAGRWLKPSDTDEPLALLLALRRLGLSASVSRLS